MFQVSINSNILYIAPSFLAFHIPLIFALQQLKVSEISTLFQPIQLRIFCILSETNFSRFLTLQLQYRKLYRHEPFKSKISNYLTFSVKNWDSHKIWSLTSYKSFSIPQFWTNVKPKLFFCEGETKLGHPFPNVSGFLKTSCLIRLDSGVRESKYK